MLSSSIELSKNLTFHLFLIDDFSNAECSDYTQHYITLCFLFLQRLLPLKENCMMVTEVTISSRVVQQEDAFLNALSMRKANQKRKTSA